MSRLILPATLVLTAACQPMDGDPTHDTGTPTGVELWQDGELLAWTDESEESTSEHSVIELEPAPFELHVSNCVARVFAAWEPALLDEVLPMQARHPDYSSEDHHPSLHGYHVGAANSEMDYLFVNGTNQHHKIVSGITPFFAARPVPGRPGWCRQVIRRWHTPRGIEDISTEPLSLLLWSDTNGDGVDDLTERFRWTLEP